MNYPNNDKNIRAPLEPGSKDGAATHRAPLRAPQELVPFTGKERDQETGFSYFGARYYDNELSGLFLSVDPMVDKYPSISPLIATHKSALRAPLELVPYCAWNPMKLVDPDGREFGDFYGRNGQYLGNDGKNDGCVYLIKNGRDAALGTWDLFKVEWKVRLHSGNRDYFDKHSEVYDNFIETVPYNLLSEAYNSIQDDGTGGIGDANNREYGGYANAEGTAWERTDIQGPVGNPQEQDFLPIYGLIDGRIKYHSHASGTRNDGNAGFSNSVGVSSFSNNTVHVDSWEQIPSEVDIVKAGINPSYVFGMGNRTLSVYNKNGIQATLPLKGTSLGKKIGSK